MEKIKLSLFEIFAHIIPGMFMFIFIILIKHDITQLISITKIELTSMNIYKVTFFIITFYLLGFIIQNPAYEVFKFTSRILWKKRMEKETSFNKLEPKITLIRHYSPSNFSIMERWFAMRAMCYSLSFSFLLLYLLILFKCLESEFNEQRISVLFFSLILYYLTLRRTITFYEWCHRLIQSCSYNMDKFEKNK